MKDFWQFVEENLNDDVQKLRLKYHKAAQTDPEVGYAFLQIEGRQKFGKKLSKTLNENPHFIFPDILAGEQCTSDRLANYHASLVNDGDRLIDLTAGLGIDCYHLSEKCSQVTAVEIDLSKAEALLQNFGTNIKVVNADCRDFLAQSPDDIADTIFIDPARRAADGSRIFAIDQCEPDVTAMMAEMLRCAKKAVIKLSPMLDITSTLSMLTSATKIIAVGTPTECKELIAVCDRSSTSPTIEAITITNDGTWYSEKVDNDAEYTDSVIYGMPQAGDYLYEPYPAVMKAGGFKQLSAKYGVNKLHPNTHLYTSPTLVPAFPGEVTQIHEVIPYSSSEIKRFKKKYPQINVAARNADISADALRKKLGVKDGGILKATLATVGTSSSTSAPQKRILICGQK